MSCTVVNIMAFKVIYFKAPQLLLVVPQSCIIMDRDGENAQLADSSRFILKTAENPGLETGRLGNYEDKLN